MATEHYPVYGKSDDHPWKSPCVCGAWFYFFENHLKDVPDADLRNG